MAFLDVFLVFVGFFFVTVAASQLAIVFPKIKLPLITGYLFIGVLAGPYVLNLVTSEGIKSLVYINQFVLAFIGFSAGAELYLPELRELFKTILLNVGMISLITFLSVTFIADALMAGGMVPFTEGFSQNCIFGIAMLFGAIMTARSPASAIAIVKETRAKGSFTRSFLGVTVVSDVVVLVLFAVSVSITRAQCEGKGFNWESMLSLLISLVFSILFGYFILGKFLVFLLYLKPHAKFAAKWLILPLGFGIFLASTAIADASLDTIGHEFNLEPLLMCIVAGYVATNQSKNRRHFLAMLQKVGPYVFIPFFTLTGAGLNLKVLVDSFLLAFIVAITRLFSIFLGSLAGGFMAKAPKKHNFMMWLALVTQAGVSLGLAGEISFQFAWGPECATTIVAVVLINQIIGPIMCKFAIKKVGEDGKAGASGEVFLGVRKATIFGADGYSLALASRLQKNHWKVIVTAKDNTFEEQVRKLNDQNTPEEFRLLTHEEINTDEQIEELPTIGNQTQETTIKIEKPPQQPAAHHHVDEEEMVWPLELVVMNEIDPSEKQPLVSETGTPALDEFVNLPYDYAGFMKAKELVPRTDVIVLNLDDKQNLDSAPFFFKNGFKRVVCIVKDPTYAGPIGKTGAVPVYMFSAAEQLLFKSVVSSNIDSLANYMGMIQPEAEKFPDNVQLLHQHQAQSAKPAFEVGLVGLDADGEETKEPNPIQDDAKGVQKFTNMVKRGFEPVKSFGKDVKQGFIEAKDSLKEMRDPKAFMEKRLDNMAVVDESELEDYMNQLSELHDAKPVGTFALFNSDFTNAPVIADRDQIESQFRRPMSVFEEYHETDEKK